MQKTDGRAAGQAVGGPVGGRIYLMDELRGFAVFCMVFYHGFYTFAYLFHWAFGEALLRFFMPAEPWFAGLFILISGISSNLSHSNLARGAKLLVIALAVSLVTGLVVPQERILFGILHFLSVCMLLFGGLEARRKKRGRPAPPFRWGELAAFAALFALTLRVPSGFAGIPYLLEIPLPAGLYVYWLSPLGFCSPDFFSADYFPLLPWVFIFFAGTVLGRLAAAGKFPRFAYPSRIPFFSWIGRHALVIYVLHQPVIFALSSLVQLLPFMGGR